MGARHFGIGIESTVGTAVAATRFFEAIGESVEDTPTLASPPGLRNYSKIAMDLMNNAAKGSVDLLWSFNGLGILAKNLWGSVTTTGAGPYVHTFPATTGVPSTDRIGLGLTLEFRRDGSLSWRYPAGKITGWKHDMPGNDYNKLSVEFSSKAGTLAGPATASYGTLVTGRPVHCTAAFDGGANLPVLNGSIQINNPLDEPFGWGSTTFIAEQDRSDVLTCTGSLEVLFLDTTQHAKFQSNADVSIVISGTVDANSSFVYTIAKAKLTKATPHNQGRDRLKATYEFEGYFNTTATECVKLVLTNGDATP